MTTGTSVCGLVYKDGVMMASDCLGSYGSLARFKNVHRMIKVGDRTLVGASGDLSDFQHIKHLLESLETEELEQGDMLDPKNVYGYLHHLLYQKRTKLEFLFNTILVGGLSESKFLACVDMLGVTYSGSTMATGFGAHIAQPLLRKQVEGREHEITEQEAKSLLEDVMRVLYYRDARSMNLIQISNVNHKGVEISEPYSLKTEWAFAESIRGYKL